MIYQLKITLTSTIPIIWRRLQVSSKMSFANLHETLQILFEWEGDHLYLFEVIRSDGKMIKNHGVTIGPNDLLAEEVTLSGVDSTIENWLTKEKDICRYIYDFGNYWQHEIILEKIIDIGESTYFYPICRKAVGEAPVEYLLGSNKLGNEELRKAINQQLKNLWDKI
ncbi:plasmid pRiA4b ORF-3 family protein [Bacillus luteolus]|uniref:Plasmid pRiA4b ORF-3 family protein n=1 Tax=Litchfieldia luteola TaxID=682179 RepID=A0ABR9QGC9_9BACI|nr:plasmid pRiA4b ORF-3 family protein [Cytobacillus luteolus]MBE4907548.1 plasmid pRiA4b ORF-3 family protein [Cytobacillus luteolus]MBP1944319.1 hypothetical protein [Cytobacillus luteolus]